MRKFLLCVVLCLATINVLAEQKIVELAEAGTLSTILTDEEVKNCQNLKIIGPINGSDIFLIRKMASYTNMTLKYLDLSEASIVESDDVYITNGYNYYTSDNVVGALMFSGCKNLTNVILPNSAVKIESSIFRDTPILECHIPKSVNNLSSSAFDDCQTIRSIIVDEGNENYCSIDGVVFSYDKKVLLICPIGKEGKYIVPESVETIGQLSFRNSHISEIVFNSKLSAINDMAFYGSHLKEVNIPKSISRISRNCFSNMEYLKTIIIPSTINRIDYRAFAFCKNISRVYTYLNSPSISISNDPFEGSGKDPILFVLEGKKTNFSDTYPWFHFPRIREFSATDGIVNKVIYYIDNIEYKSFSLKYGENIIPELNPTKEGYDFSGWSEIPETMPAEDVMVTGTFSINKYKLIYKVDDKEYMNYEVEYGSTITPEAAPTKEHYTFSGWSDIPETMPANDVTITGTFSINKHKLIYKVDGTDYKSYDMEYGASITPEAAPTKEGYTFSGWDEVPEAMPDKDVTVSGSFSINKYKLIYKVDDEEYKKYEIEYNSSITPEAAPTKEGYTFSGWDEVPETMPDNDVTVSGTFSINNYKLFYKVDGADYKNYEIEYGASITPETAPTKEHYTFSGWSEIPEAMPAENITVTGTFSLNKHKLTYKVNEEVYKSNDVEYGTSIIPEEALSKDHYTFSGWSDIPETMPDNDVTVTGTLIADKFKLIYMVDGTDYKNYEIDYGAPITPETAPTKEHYTFSGWSEIPEAMPAENITVTGTFSLNKHKLTYKVNEEVYKSNDVEYGTSIIPEEALSKDHYTFSGWSDIPETMPDNDVIVTGTLIADKFKLIYKVDGADYKSYDVEYGSTITPETAPTKEGYSFSGWNTIPATMPAEDITVTGTFSINKYKLIYKVDGVDYKSYDVEYGASITPEAAPTKDGYIFSGWSEIPKTMPARDVTVTGTLTVKAAPTPEPTPEPMPEPKGTTFDVDTDDSSTKELKVTFVVNESSGSTTPTVAISDDKDASGSVSIPEAVTHNGVEYKVTEIGEGAFQNNTGLTEVSIPASITSIGANAFAGCKNLQSITINIIVPINLSVIGTRGLTRAIGSDVFEGVNKETCILYVPAGSVDAYKAAPVWKEFKNILPIKSSTGINGVEAEGEPFDVFTISGQKVKSKVTSLDGLPRGIYIVKGKKVLKK